MNKNILFGSLTGISLFLLIWLGGSFYVGQQIEPNIKSAIQELSRGCSVRLENWQHKAGTFSSSGELDVRVGDQCNTDPDLRDALVAKLSYQAGNLISFGSLVDFKWTLKQTSQPDNSSDRLLEFEGQGVRAWGDKVISDINAKEMTGYFENGNWRLEPLQGNIEWKQQAVKFNLKTPRLTSRGDGEAIDAQNINIALDFSDIKMGIGTSVFSIDKISTGSGFAQGFSISSEATQNADNMDVSVLYSLNGLSFMDYNGHDFNLQFSIKGLHIPSIQAIKKLMEQSSSLDNLTLEEKNQVRESFKTLIRHGLSLNMDKLSGGITKGNENSNIDGRMVITIKPDANSTSVEPVQLAKVLESSGFLLFKGNTLDEMAKAQLLQSGFVVENAEGLKAGYEYFSGIFKVNERTFDAGAVEQTLMQADEFINHFLEQPLVTEPEEPIEIPDDNPTPDELESETPATPEAAAPQIWVQSIVVGQVTIAPDLSVIEDQQGHRLRFETNSPIGKQIFDTCREGKTCVVSALHEKDSPDLIIKQLNSVAMQDPEKSTTRLVQDPVKPSFDCGKASSAVEKLICGSNELAQQDLELSKLYKLAVAAGGDTLRIVNEQKVWIKSVRGACKDAACLSQAYQLRISQLATAS